MSQDFQLRSRSMVELPAQAKEKIEPLALIDERISFLGLETIKCATEIKTKTFPVAIASNKEPEASPDKLNADTPNKKPQASPDVIEADTSNIVKTVTEEVETVSKLVRETQAKITAKGLSDRVCVLTDEDQKITLIVGRILGSGAYGAVHQVRDISCREDEAIKLALRPDDKSLEAEYRLLQQVNPQGIPGLQLPPRKFVYLSENKQTPRPGYLTPRYDGSLENQQLQTSASIREAMFQLTSGLCALHDRHVYHGDIKTSNILQMPGRYDLADLGGAKQLKDIESILDGASDFCSDRQELRRVRNAIFSIHSPFYVNPKDILTLTLLLENFALKCRSNPEQKKERIKEIAEDIFLLMRSRDIYALAITLQELTLGANTPLTNIFLHQYSFYKTESEERSRAISCCLQEMKTSYLTPSLSNFKRACHARLSGFLELRRLMNGDESAANLTNAVS